MKAPVSYCHFLGNSDLPSLAPPSKSTTTIGGKKFCESMQTTRPSSTCHMVAAFNSLVSCEWHELVGYSPGPPRLNDFMRAPALRYTEKHAKLCLYWPCLDVSFWAGCVRHAFPFTLIDCVQLHSNSSWLGRFFRAAWLRSVSVTILPPIRLKVRGFSSIGRSNSASLVAGNKSRGYSKENSQGYHLKSNCADRLIVIESDNFYSIRQLNAPWILFCVLKNSLKVIFRWKVCFQKIFIWRLPGAFENKFWMLWISSSCEKFREENSVKIRNPAPVAGTASTASGKCWLIFKN